MALTTTVVLRAQGLRGRLSRLLLDFPTDLALYRAADPQCGLLHRSFTGARCPINQVSKSRPARFRRSMRTVAVQGDAPEIGRSQAAPGIPRRNLPVLVGCVQRVGALRSRSSPAPTHVRPEHDASDSTVGGED